MNLNFEQVATPTPREITSRAYSEGTNHCRESPPWRLQRAAIN